MQKPYLILLILLPLIAYADLPVHCVKSEIVGKWQIQISHPIVKGNSRSMVTCGHEVPDNPNTSFKASNGKIQGVQQTFDIELTKDNKVLGELGEGTWTMIYDEGWEIDYGGIKFMNFFKYSKKELSLFYKIDCGKTLVGWYNNYTELNRGCSQGVKISDENQQNKDRSTFIQMGSSNIIKQKSKQNQQVSFIQRRKEDLTKVVEKINSRKELSWKAKVYDNFIQLNIQELNQLAGRKKKKVLQKKQYFTSFIQKEIKEELIQTTESSRKQEFPKNFSWQDKVPQTIQQAGCGSCYAIATAQMLSARIKIQSGEDVLISAQHSIDCNYYNQGCEGGYSTLVGKFGNEFEMVPESCHPYKAKNGKCETCDLSSLEFIYKVVNYGYIGGAYGKSNEYLMMEEMYKNGPIVVSFEPDYEFMSYSEGIYKSEKIGLKNDDWEKVDHSVLCVGWGEDDINGKYWIVQNSWGESWGEKGYFKIARGNNEASIESMGEFATIQKVQNPLYKQNNNSS